MSRHEDELMEAPERIQTQVQPFTIGELLEATQRYQAPRPAKIKTPNYAEGTNIREYLDLFQRIARQNRWDPAEAGIQLRCSLTGKTLQTAYAFPHLDFDGLAEALVERHGMNAREARLMIRRLARTKEMTPEELADEIRRLFRTGLCEHLTECQLAQQELEVFLDTLDWPEMSMHIEAMRPTSLQEALRSVKLLQGYRTRYNATKKHEGRPWLREFLSEEPETTPVSTATEVTATIAQIQRQLTDLQKERTVRCYHCGGNHFVSGCPDRPPRENPRQEANTARNQKSGN